MIHMIHRSHLILSILLSAALTAPFAHSDDDDKAQGGDRPKASSAEDKGGDTPAPKKEETKGAVLNLFAEGVKHWKVLDDFPSNGGIEKGDEEGIFRVGTGDPLSGVRYEGPEELPVTNYEFTVESRRTKGGDFFCAITFPVNSIKTCCTFVAGGWGGALTGISSIDGMDAANNSTSTFHKYEKNAWHTFKIRVTPKELKVWQGKDAIVELELADRKISMRWGDIEYCQPFGLATYLSTGEFRNFKLRRLDEKPLPLKKKEEKDEKAKEQKEEATSEK